MCIRDRLTGAYGYPSPTLTGEIDRDIVFVKEILGVNLAISDHRAPNVTEDQLIQIASKARVAGMLSGKPGIVVLHMKHHNAWFSTEHSRHTGFACNLNQLILRHIRCPVIRDCQIHTQNLLHKYNISIYLACERRARISVSTCKPVSYTHLGE